jgi:5-oxoprolinase (ATP-hydrolysing) subunit C
MFEVLKAGLETSVQDFPGRLGFWEQGFPPSGPMDAWSFRLANLLAGNDVGAAGLECQFLGPTIRFERDCVIAVTGADMGAEIDGSPLPLWESIAVRRGQVLSMGAARVGARAYIAFSGGIDVAPVMGSRSTFHMAGVGGVEGCALKTGQRVPIGAGSGTPGWRARRRCRPPLVATRRWEIEVVAGPNDDWIDGAGQERFLTSDWKLSGKSSRTGFRLEGPRWTFSQKATQKLPEHGQEPSNILDRGYPLGAINLAGQTPIILVNDAPSTGGFINPYTVATAAFWKLAQSRPGDIYRFRAVSLHDAQALRRQIDALCTRESLHQVSGIPDRAAAPLNERGLASR